MRAHTPWRRRGASHAPAAAHVGGKEGVGRGGKERGSGGRPSPRPVCVWVARVISGGPLRQVTEVFLNGHSNDALRVWAHSLTDSTLTPGAPRA